MRKSQMMFAVLILMGASLTSCNNKTTATDLSSDSIASEVPDIGSSVGASDIEAIEQYLVSEIGKNYAEAEYCVPLLRIVNKEEQEDGEILVWGDYCVFNYNLVGDTLKCVSGGNHPGLMHVCLADDNLHFVVTAFEQVEDGAGNLESAKRIFGDKYENYKDLCSDVEGREMDRADRLAYYVETHNLPATMYQDYGWPARQLPK